MPGPGRFKVVVADFLDETSVESPVLGEIADLVLCRAMREEELAEHLPAADAIMLFHDIPHLGEASLARARRCKCVVRAGVGYNNIDLDAATRHGVIVCNVPDYGTEEVADHAIMFLLALARRLVPCHEAIRAGTWHYQTAVGTPRLRGKTLGLIGCGRIGTATAVQGQGPRAGRGLLRPAPPPGDGQGAGHPPGLRARGTPRSEPLRQPALLSRRVDSPYHQLGNHRPDAARRHPDQHGARALRRRGGPAGRSRCGPDRVRRAWTWSSPSRSKDARLRDHPRILFTPHSAFYSVEGFVELRTKTAEEVRRILLGRASRATP